MSCERLVKQVKAGAEGGDCKENHAYIFNSVHRINTKLHSVNNLFLQEWRQFVISLDLKFLFEECGTHKKNWGFYFMPHSRLSISFTIKGTASTQEPNL